MHRPIYSLSQQAENSLGSARFPGQTQHATQPTCVHACVHDSLRPIDHHPPGSSAHGILQARTLEWVAMPSSRGSCQPRDRAGGSCHLLWQMGSLPIMPPGKPLPAHIRLFTPDPLILILTSRKGVFREIAHTWMGWSQLGLLPCL